MIKFYFYKTRVSLGTLSFSLIVMSTLGLYARHLHQHVEDLQCRLSSLRHLTVRSQEAATLIKTHEADFAAFESCGFEHPLTPEALQSARSHTIEFGSFSAANGDTKNNGLVFQEVAFSIPCLQDRDVFALLDQLTTQGPGIFQIHDVTITRVSSLSEEMLEKIALGKPQALFDGKITATWIHR